MGKQQFDRYIDNDVITKSICIFNQYPDNIKTVHKSNDCRSVVYVGAIIEGKGFKELCQIWPGILKEVPDAQLLVVGKGDLYGYTKLGDYNIADEKYEEKFIPFITDSQGKILPSVKFLGVLGAEKNDVFLHSSCGIVNPTNKNETFGMVIVEMAACKLPIVTIWKNGYLDTVINNKTGILEKSIKGVQRSIIKMLKEPKLNEELANNAKEFIKKFSPDVLMPQWEKVLYEVYTDKPFIGNPTASKPYNVNLKYIRIINRKLRFSLKLKFIPSLVAIEYSVRDLLRYFKKII